jgi:hypothetical protein
VRPPLDDAAGAALAGLGDLLQRIQANLDRHGDLQAVQKDPLVVWLKALLGAQDPDDPAPRPGTAAPAAAAPSRSRAAQEAPADALRIVLATRSGAPPAAPETWESWIKATVRTLSDPAASPREAPFHAAQAREGTAFYEIPLPWSPQTPLQLWVEKDRPEKGKAATGDTQRVLLGLSFTRLGETRLGIAKGPAGLQVRVWAEHPAALEASQQRLNEELQALGAAVDLRIYALGREPGGSIPSIKSLVTGATLQILG